MIARDMPTLAAPRSSPACATHTGEPAATPDALAEALAQLAHAACESAVAQDPAAASSDAQQSGARRLNVDPEDVRRGLGQLVLTIAKLLHEVLERQAIRRMDGDSLTDAQVERLGQTLMLQAREIERLTVEFGLRPSDLNIDLGPLGKLV